jgi:hypothetical protein
MWKPIWPGHMSTAKLNKLGMAAAKACNSKTGRFQIDLLLCPLIVTFESDDIPMQTSRGTKTEVLEI